MKKIFLTFCVLFCLSAYAQKEASNWYFGDNAGISFDIDAGTVTAVNDGELSTEEGCTSISDVNGDLLFYTDGRTVFNKDHDVMLNGSGLRGDQSSTQSALIVPKPDTPDIYYIFTVDSPAIDNVDTGFNYYVVDMTLDNGLGGIVLNTNGTPHTSLLSDTSEKLSAVLQDCQSQNIWVITYGNDPVSGSGNNAIYSYLVTSAGVSTTPVISSWNFLNTNEDRGYLKFSPNGTQIACANVGQGLILFDFDLNLGTATYKETITPNLTSPGGDIQQAYGVEFSPNNELLYVSTYSTANNNNNSPASQYGALLQYDLTVASNVEATEFVIDERQTYRGGLQLGPDGRIYRAMSLTYGNGSPFLSVIGDPNQVGFASNYQHNAISLTANSRQGLPPFITSFFSENIDIIQNGSSTTDLALCTGDTYTLMAEDIAGATYSWYLDGNLLAEADFDLNVNVAGFYEVFIELSGANCGVLEGKADVVYYDLPTANTAQDLFACEDNPDGSITASFNFTSQIAEIIGTQNATTFEVKFFNSLADAMSSSNEITGNYDTASTTIFARIENRNNTPCYDITSFNITVYDTPIVNNTNGINECDNDTNPLDGFTQLILSDFDSNVLGTQNRAEFTITYHSSLADANTNIAALPNNYINQTAINETIFVRIENNLDNSCFSTDSIDIVINPIPEAFNTDIYQCDEQGMVDGFTTFNLLEVNNSITGTATNNSTKFYTSLIDAQNDTNPINGSAYDNISNPETIYVRVTNDTTGCVNFSELILETSSTQINNYSAQPVCDELGSEDGINTFNLNDFSSDILSGLPAGLNITYYENETNALLENNPLPLTYQNTTPYSQTIYVRVENNNACYGINEVLLTISPLPDVDSDETAIYCLNDFPQTITLDAGLNDANTGDYSFSWSTAENTETIDINAVGIYTVSVTNNLTFCSKSRVITVEPSNIATIENIEVIDGSLNNNQVTVLTSGEGEYQFALTNQEGIQTPFQASSVFSSIKPGFYSVIVRDIKNNCGILEDIISVIGFPLYFTPNNDGKNDTWQVYGLSKDFQPNSEILIFDRYGKLLKQISPINDGWDGTYNGSPMPTNDYWFTVKLEDGRTYTDHFTLKR